MISINPKSRNDSQIFQPKSNSTAPSASKRKISYAFATQKYRTFRNATRPNGKKVTSSAGSLYFLRSNCIRYLVLNVTFSGTPRVLCPSPYKEINSSQIYCRTSVVSAWVYLLVLCFILIFLFVCKIVPNLFPGWFWNPASFQVCISRIIIYFVWKKHHKKYKCGIGFRGKSAIRKITSSIH